MVRAEEGEVEQRLAAGTPAEPALPEEETYQQQRASGDLDQGRAVVPAIAPCLDDPIGQNHQACGRGDDPHWIESCAPLGS